MKCSEIFHSVYLPKEMFQESLEQFSWNLILRYTEKLTSMKYSERKLLSVSFAAGVTVKMHSPKIVLPSNYLPGNKNSPVFFSQEIITRRSIYLLVKYHSLQEIWTPL